MHLLDQIHNSEIHELKREIEEQRGMIAGLVELTEKLQKHNFSLQLVANNLTKELEDAKVRMNDVKAQYEEQFKREFDEQRTKLETDIQNWKYFCKVEALAREKSEMQRIRLEEKLVEGSISQKPFPDNLSYIRIEEWKHHFLMETQERAIERQALLDRIAELSTR